MRPKHSGQSKASAERVVKDIRRATRRHFSAEDKIRIVLGADQRLTPYEGLKALTIWAAAQYYEEDRKGTLTPGKLADLVILDQNPLTVEPSKIHTIRVVKTIKEGKAVWSAPAPMEAQP